MRRYAVREAPRAILLHELAEHVRGEEHLHPEEPERAEAVSRALQEIEMGAQAAQALDAEYRVNEELCTRYGVTEGTHAEILAELDRLAADVGRAQWGKDEKVRKIERGIRAIESGEWEVRVRHIVYRIVEDRKSAYRVVED